MNRTRLIMLASALAALPALGAETPAQSLAEFIKFRDPFHPPEVKKEEVVVLSELERYAATEFKVLGVITGPVKKRAMILTPDNKTYAVAEGMLIGQRKGHIRRITTKSVIIREQIVNALGEKEDLDTELPLEAQAPGRGGGGRPPGQG